MDDQHQVQPVVIERERKSHAGVIAAVIAIVVIILLVIYGIPYLTGSNNSTTDGDVDPVPTTTIE